MNLNYYGWRPTFVKRDPDFWILESSDITCILLMYLTDTTAIMVFEANNQVLSITRLLGSFVLTVVFASSVFSTKCFMIFCFYYEIYYSYNQAPPGLIKEEEERPEDCIPDLPENQAARKFLSKAPTKGLWMPLGKEVKVMKCEYHILVHYHFVLLVL